VLQLVWGLQAIKHSPTFGDNHKMGFPFAIFLGALAWAPFSFLLAVPFFIVV